MSTRSHTLRRRAGMLCTLGLALLAACPSPTDVPPEVPVASVQVSPNPLELEAGASRQLTASVLDAQGKPLTRNVVWRSSAPTVASVDASGVVQALAAGPAVITATAGGKEGSTSLQVVEVPGEIALAPGQLTFSQISGGPAPEPRTVAVTATRGILNGLVVEIDYAVGGPTGWLTATLSGATTPATLTLSAAAGALESGSYTAAVNLRSSTRPNVATRTVDVLFTVAPRPQTSITASDRHNCALTPAGEAFCWGYNGMRQLGVGSTAEYETTPVRLPGGLQFSSVTTGELHACGLTADGRAYCWGTGFMGDGNSATTNAPPTEVSGGHRFTALAAGYRHTCGLTLAGEAYCWGANNGAQMGDVTRADKPEPVKIPGGLTFVAITAGAEHNCALTAAGDAYCWGRAFYGRLGLPVTSSDVIPTPTKVAGNTQYAAIEAGNLHTCAISLAGEAFCWGYNGNGQLGDESRTSRNTPTPVAGNLRFTAVSAGNYHSCAITTGGQPYCWGYRAGGAIGDGSNNGYALSPSQVAGGLTLKQITAGNDHSCAVTTTEEAYCWGFNTNGAVGDGTRTHRLEPVRIRIE